MPESKLISMLGLARRAGRLSMGHDMVLQSLIKNKSKAVLICEDASKRLVREFEEFTKRENKSVPVIVTKLTMEQVHFSLGYRAGIMSVDDENFSARILSLLEQEEMIYGN